MDKGVSIDFASRRESPRTNERSGDDNRPQLHTRSVCHAIACLYAGAEGPVPARHDCRRGVPATVRYAITRGGAKARHGVTSFPDGAHGEPMLRGLGNDALLR